MREFAVRALIILCSLSFLFPQVDEKLKKDIRSTGNIHFPLPLDHSKSFETFGLTKTVLVSEVLCDMEDMSRWSHSGIGRMSQTAERSISGKHSLRLVAPSYIDEIPPWGLGRGTSMASFDVGGKSWEKYNRIHLYVYPDCEGARTVYLNLYVENDGKIKVPDPYGREGYHEMNLINGQWNECFVEMSELPRDKVTKISLAIEVFGKERTMGDVLQFDVSNLALQVVDKPEAVSGWKPAENRIIFSTSGYRPDSVKSAIVNVARHNGRFQILDDATSRSSTKGRSSRSGRVSATSRPSISPPIGAKDNIGSGSGTSRRPRSISTRIYGTTRPGACSISCSASAAAVRFPAITGPAIPTCMGNTRGASIP